MEYSNWAESLQTETPLPSFPQPSSSCPPTYYPSYPQNFNPNPSSSLPLNPPGVDPQTPLNAISYAAHEPVHGLVYAQSHVGANSSSRYCLDRNWAARKAVRQFGTDTTLYASPISICTGACCRGGKVRWCCCSHGCRTENHHRKLQDSFQRLVHEQDGTRAEWEYPFAVAGINISFMLAQLLDLQAVLQAVVLFVMMLQVGVVLLLNPKAC